MDSRMDNAKDARWYSLDVTTGDDEGAGADGAVGVLVCDGYGVRTVEQVLAYGAFDDLARGHTDRHYVVVPPRFAEPSGIVLSLKTARHWLVHEIRLTAHRSRRCYSTGVRDVWLTTVDGPGLLTLALTETAADSGEAVSPTNDGAERGVRCPYGAERPARPPSPALRHGVSGRPLLLGDPASPDGGRFDRDQGARIHR